MIKEVLQSQFPSLGTDAVTLTATAINALPDDITAVSTSLTASIAASLAAITKNLVFAAANISSNASVSGTSVNIASVALIETGVYDVTLSSAGSSVGNLIVVPSIRSALTNSSVRGIKAISSSTSVIRFVIQDGDGNLVGSTNFSFMVIDSGA
jgi:hypothetical protein